MDMVRDTARSGDTIRILKVNDPIGYALEGKTGIVRRVKNNGTLLGTWGRTPIYTSDKYEVIRRAKSRNYPYSEIARKQAESLRPLAERIKTRVEAVTGPMAETKSRKSEAVWQRTYIAVLLAEKGASDTAIGILLGKDRSTVINLRNRFKNAMSCERQYAAEIRDYRMIKEGLDNTISTSETQTKNQDK